MQNLLHINPTTLCLPLLSSKQFWLDQTQQNFRPDLDTLKDFSSQEFEKK